MQWEKSIFVRVILNFDFRNYPKERVLLLLYLYRSSFLPLFFGVIITNELESLLATYTWVYNKHCNEMSVWMGINPMPGGWSQQVYRIIYRHAHLG